MVENLANAFQGHGLEIAQTESTIVGSVWDSEEQTISNSESEREWEESCNIISNIAGYGYNILEVISTATEELMIAIRPGPLRDF